MLKKVFRTSPNDLPIEIAMVAIALLVSFAYYFISFRMGIFYHDTDILYWSFWQQYSKSSLIDTLQISNVAGQGAYSQPILYWLNPALLISTVASTTSAQYWVTAFVTYVFELIALVALASSLQLSKRQRLLFIAAAIIFTALPFATVSEHIFRRLTAVSIMRPVAYLTAAGILWFLRKGGLWRIALVACSAFYGMLLNPLYFPIYLFLPVVFVYIFTGKASISLHNAQLARRGLAVTAALAVSCLPFIPYMLLNSARAIFGAEIHSEVQTFDYLNVVFFRKENIVFTLATIVSAGYLFRKSDALEPQHKQLLFASTACSFLLVLIGLVYTFSGIKWKYPSPLYLEQAFYPFVLLPVVYAASRTNGKVKLLLPIALILVLGRPTQSFIPKVGDSFKDVIRQGRLLAAGVPAAPNAKECHPGAGMHQFLRANLSQEKQFKGSVATVVGVPGSPVGRALGFPDEHAPYTKQLALSIPDFLECNFDSDISMLHLWMQGVPTLEDTNHMVSAFKYTFFSRLLGRPQDYQTRNWLWASKIEPALFSLLGVRYVLTDQALDQKAVYQETANGLTVSLYELPAPNLGNYAPRTIIPVDGAPEFIRRVRSQKIDYTTTAFVHESDLAQVGTIAGTVKSTSYRIDGNGVVHFTASAEGRSLVVLPFEFRNCLRFAGKGEYSVLRVNMFLTGIVFNGDIDITIEGGGTGYFTLGSYLKDQRDYKKYKLKLLLKEPDMIVPYPDGYQPRSLFR